MDTKKPQWFLHVVRGFGNVHVRKIFSFFRLVADGAGTVCYTVLILHIVLTAFWERGFFSRPDAIFGLLFAVYELPDFPERISRFSDGLPY